MNDRQNKTAADFFDIAFSFEEEKDYERALENYTKAINMDYSYAIAYFNRGNVHKKKGNYGSAISDYSSAIRINSDDKDFYINRGVAYFNNGDFGSAFQDFWQGIKKSFG